MGLLDQLEQTAPTVPTAPAAAAAAAALWPLALQQDQFVVAPCPDFEGDFVRMASQAEQRGQNLALLKLGRRWRWLRPLLEQRGLLREWIVEIMRAEWAGGRDIGEEDVLVEVATGIGLDAGETRAAWEDAEKLKVLDDNWAEVQELGLIGVPSVQIGEELFWGSDRLEYIVDHLTALRARRV